MLRFSVNEFYFKQLTQNYNLQFKKIENCYKQKYKMLNALSIAFNS